jgi:hypothetical protein
VDKAFQEVGLVQVDVDSSIPSLHTELRSEV